MNVLLITILIVFKTLIFEVHVKTGFKLHLAIIRICCEILGVQPRSQTLYCTHGWHCQLTIVQKHWWYILQGLKINVPIFNLNICHI